jgi:hypothetical protein
MGRTREDGGAMPQLIRVGSMLVVALALVAGGVEGTPSGDLRLEAIWKRAAAPTVVPPGVEIDKLLATSPEESPAQAASRELLAGSFALMEMLEIGVDEFDVSFYQGGANPITLPVGKKLKSEAPGARLEMTLKWEGPVLVVSRKVERGATSVERLFIGRDKKLYVELEWSGPPALQSLRVIATFDRLSGGFE